MKYNIYTKEQIRRMNELALFHLNRNIKDQLLKTIEELNSLSKALCKFALNEKIDFELLDELYDADYMMFQIKIFLFEYSNTEYSEKLFKKYMDIVNSKLYREYDRWLKK